MKSLFAVRKCQAPRCLAYVPVTAVADGEPTATLNIIVKL